MKQVILISGKAQHGKDTAANLIKTELEKTNNKVLIMHYADLLKYICKTYFGWNGEKDDAGRTLLQYVGTDIVRSKQPNYWVDFVISFLKLFSEEWDYIIIPDTRFPNEVFTISSIFPSTYVRVVRENFVSPLTEEQQNHPSEKALDDYIPDYYLINDGSMEKFSETVETFIQALT